ncbi:putative RDD family membrane protein YckC [Peribacillus deserti]|uniref:RDD family membrane protein YckC n=1 Tax=Peribacillus deserti TaxID=673318 RepID=A0ABS2QF03_9BACI|nr:RDD family protein [Peribacillus deserti]MBM7691732.1 putative RDD family membrane protein YckC [Peribacillus deserti]
MSNPAGFWRRLAANLLDGIIIGLPLTIISYLVTGNWDGDPATNVINILYSLIIPVLWYGYTIGKKIMGIRIAKVNGAKIGFGAMFMRIVVGGIVYLVTVGIGLIVSAFMVGLRKDKRALHDLIAGTYVTFDAPSEDIKKAAV